MLFHARLTHSPAQCWARDEHEGKATEMVARLEDAEDTYGVSVHSSYVAPNEHAFYFIIEADTFEGLTGLFGPPLLQDHDADIVPITSFGKAMDALDVE